MNHVDLSSLSNYRKNKQGIRHTWHTKDNGQNKVEQYSHSFYLFIFSKGQLEIRRKSEKRTYPFLLEHANLERIRFGDVI